MKKNSFYKKMIMSVAGAALVSVGLNQSPNNAFNSGVTEVSAAKKTKKVKTVGANSAVYQKKGKKMVKTKKTIKVGKKVHVYAKKTVKGKTYYKIGKNQYIKAANVDGKTREAGKKTVLYTRSGKVIKNSKVRKGQKIKVYGGVVTIKGKKYYSTKYGYIKVSALTKKAPVVKPNNDTSDNTSTPTTTKPVENNSNGSNGSTTGSNSNGSNSANSSASNSSSSGSISVPTGNDSSSNNTGSNGSSSNGGSSNGSGSTGSSSNNTNSNSSDNNNSNSSSSNSSDNNSSNDSGSNSSDNNSSNDSGSNSSDNNSSNGSGSNSSDNNSSNDSGSSSSDNNNSNGSGSNSSDNNSNDSGSNSSDNNNSNSSGSNSSDNSSNDSGSNSSDNSSNDSGSNSSDNNSSNSSESNYAENTIVIPSDYTLEKVNKADASGATTEDIRALDNASSTGMKTNKFKSESQADDEKIVDLNALTNSQSKELSDFFVKMLNSVRVQLNEKPIHTDPNNQKLANDIAAIYLKNKKFGFVTETEPTGHYVNGIVQAAQNNGLNINDNYIEDLNTNFQIEGSTSIFTEKISMTQAKKFVYDAIVGMLFGGTTEEDGTIREGTEYHHAASLLKDDNLTGAVSFHNAKPDSGLGAGYGVTVTHFILINQSTIEYSNRHGGTYKPTGQK
ncbi:SLAP domain protein [Lactobacillus kimbladii]|uniref:SLAP domain protein n=1 Tax=Lactobacillus kimbladii TaxID=1218506 RepID=A0A0F4LJT8_9LACO|nr:SEC10/PgrA surface exclusion domain-containing protein [Lactobacillus kimbladii]KJY58855.1 SLAP domain protein [Lactobacillus kimbladii]